MYRELIKSIKPYIFSQYKDISSNEKLAIYACFYLTERNIPLTFTHICVTSFLMFPEKFYFDDEYKEYPHIEKLNRTILHMVTNKSNKYLVGSAKTGYKITRNGLIVAKQVESDILGSVADKEVINTKVMDLHKKGHIQEYNKLINSDYYTSYSVDSEVKLDFIWSFFMVIPYTQINKINRILTSIENYANSIDDQKCLNFIRNTRITLKG
jgi:hypothetical protein